MLFSTEQVQQHYAVTKFTQHYLDASREKVASRQQQDYRHADLLREQGTYQFQQSRQQQDPSAAPAPKHARRPKNPDD